MKTYTVSELWRPLRWETQLVPFLRLSGKWLGAAGFTIGRKVTVRVENGALILTPVPDVEQAFIGKEVAP